MKPIDKLSARELQALNDKRYKLVTSNNRALIDAGFGEVKGNDIRAMDHPLAEEYRRVNEAWQEVISEMEARKRYHGELKPIKRRL